MPVCAGYDCFEVSTLTVMIIALPEEKNCRILYRKAKAGLSLCSLSGSSTGHFQRDSEQ